MHACLAQLDQHQTCQPVMVSVVSSNPTGGNFIFLRHLNVNFVQNDRNVRFVLFTKTSNIDHISPVVCETQRIRFFHVIVKRAASEPLLSANRIATLN